LLDLAPEERAWAGLFLAFQYPVEIPGVSNTNFMRSALNQVRSHRGLPALEAGEFLKIMRDKAALVQLDPSFLSRPVNLGFSGGEKKRNEIFQMAMLDPQLAILDETDSGLDIDALRIVAEGVRKLRRADNSFLVITHYQRLLDHLRPDIVHVLMDGKIVRTGNDTLALELEEKGYDWLKAELA
ncbi:MAG: Fe-S cluster assembly ATPase SufC, partial [Bacteroidota bacterium]